MLPKKLTVTTQLLGAIVVSMEVWYKLRPSTINKKRFLPNP